jgi:hypothetical protein
MGRSIRCTIAARMKGVRGVESAGLVGDMADLESIVALKDFLTYLGSPNMDCRTDGSSFDVNERSGYLFNSTIAGSSRRMRFCWSGPTRAGKRRWSMHASARCI